MRDVVANVSRGSLLCKEEERSRAVGDVEERAPLEAVAKDANLAVQRAVQAEDVHNEIEAHSRRVTEQRPIPQDHWFPAVVRHLREGSLRFDLRDRVHGEGIYRCFLVELAWCFAVDRA